MFGSLAKGYKAGGYNSVEVGSEFDNEDVWNVETGIKSVFPNAGVMLNASAFYYIYDNKQSIALVNDVAGSDLPQYLIDTSDEQAWGIDVDAQWQADRPLHAVRQRRVHRRDVQGQDDAGHGSGRSVRRTDGRAVPQRRAGRELRWVLGGAGNLDLSGRYAYRGKSRCNADSAAVREPAQAQPNFEVGEATQRLDMRLGWNSANDKFGLAAYVTNVLDDQYVTGINNLTTDTFGTPFASISEPRMWGVEATVKF